MSVLDKISSTVLEGTVGWFEVEDACTVCNKVTIDYRHATDLLPKIGDVLSLYCWKCIKTTSCTIIKIVPDKNMEG